MIISILGRHWDLEFIRRLPRVRMGDVSVPVNGMCEAPGTPDKHIYIRSTLKDEQLLEVLLHEFLHAAGWHIDEEFVEKFATDAAAVLWQLGYRRCQTK